MLDSSLIQQVAVPVLTLLVGWITGRKRNKADTEIIESNALSGMQNAYAQMVVDMKERYMELQSKVDELQKVNDVLTKSVKDLTRIVNSLKKENEKLRGSK